MEQMTAPQVKRMANQMPGGLPVIVVAAGSSTRMGGVNKQLTMLCGEPVLIRTLRAFDHCPLITRIILVVRAQDLSMIQHLCDEYGISKLTDLVSGGANRHESVQNGFARLSSAEDKVLIHDGARPLVTPEVIANVVAALKTERAAVCAVPIVDTVKRADENGTVGETVDRAGLYSIQTPQGVRTEDYRNACRQVADAALLTDDAALLEQIGVSVRIVAGSPFNLKITTPQDLFLAETFIKGADL